MVIVDALSILLSVVVDELAEDAIVFRQLVEIRSSVGVIQIRKRICSVAASTDLLSFTVEEVSETSTAVVDVRMHTFLPVGTISQDSISTQLKTRID